MTTTVGRQTTIDPDEPLTPEQWALYAANQGLLRRFFGIAARRLSPLTAPQRMLLMDIFEAKMLRAVQGFDPHSGNAFSTYAGVCLLRTGFTEFVRQIQKTKNQVQSLDYTLGEGNDEYQPGLLSRRMRSKERDPAAVAQESELLALVRESLDPRTAQMLLAIAVDGEAVNDVAQREGISRERVRQVLNVAKGKLRRKLKESNR